MNTVKEQIEELLQFYRDDFRKNTGIELIVHPAAIFSKMNLEDLTQKTLEHFKIATMKTSNRNHEQLIPRKFFIQIATSMGYTSRQVAEVIGCDRTTISHHLKPSNDVGDMDKLRAKYMQHLFSKI